MPNLEAVHNPVELQWDPPLLVKSNHVAKEHTPIMSSAIPKDTLPCLVNGPNNREETMLLDGVWVWVTLDWIPWATSQYNGEDWRVFLANEYWRYGNHTFSILGYSLVVGSSTIKFGSWSTSTSLDW